MTDDSLAGGLAALGHPIRLALYRLLVGSGSDGIGPVAIAASMKIQRNLVSYHLQPLVAAGLVTSQRRGRDVNYRAEPIGLNRLVRAVLALSDPAPTGQAEEGAAAT